jgi:hypothetical protein
MWNDIIASEEFHNKHATIFAALSAEIDHGLETTGRP